MRLTFGQCENCNCHKMGIPQLLRLEAYPFNRFIVGITPISEFWSPFPRKRFDVRSEDAGISNRLFGSQEWFGVQFHIPPPISCSSQNAGDCQKL